MSIKDPIGSYEIPNLGGTRAGKGFSYQNHWAIKKLIDLHSSGEDYVMLFEVYDDISVLNSEDNPTKISIYQVKSKQHQTPITLAQLCTKVKNKPSILGKLLLTKRDLPIELSSAVDSLHIVSNSSYQHKKSYHSAVGTQVSVTDHYGDDVKVKIQELSKQTGMKDGDVQDLLKITFLIKSPLSYDEPDRQIRDLLCEFFNDQFDNSDFNIVPFYQQLLTEIENKSNAEKIPGYEKTLESKSLSRSWFDDVLNKITPDAGHQLATIVNDLQRDGWAADEIIALERAWRQMEIDNLYDEAYHNGKILEIIDNLILAFESKNLKYADIVKVMMAELKENYSVECDDKADYYLKSLILWRTLNYRIKALGS